MGFDNLHALCGATETCEAVFMMTEKDTGINRKIMVGDFWVDSEANKYALHIKDY
jgi:hypothetical protein